MSEVQELLDRVDEDDDVIGTTNKEEAHREGYIHRVVAVYVFDQAGNLYVQNHVKSALMDHSVGGHVKQGESYERAALREAQEELGIEQPLEFVRVFYSDETFTGSNYRHMFALFKCVAKPGWKFHANEEVKTIVPLPLDSLVAHMNKSPSNFTGGFLSTMAQYLRHVDSPLILDVSKYTQGTISP